MEQDVPQPARARNDAAETHELRVYNCPRSILMWLDAESMARNIDRGPLVIEILGKWAAEVAHQHMVRGRVIGSNPVVPDITAPGSLPQ